MLGRRRLRTQVNTSGPHPFVEPPDSRLGLAIGAGQSASQLQSAASALVAGATVRPARCALPGCGKLRDDPIHWPAD